MNQIAVGIDFSPECITALEQAMAIARRSGLGITAIHAIDSHADGASASVLELIAEHRAGVREHLGELRERYSGQGVEISLSLIDGHPDEALCEAADALGAVLTIVGTHGRSGLSRFFLGSVSEQVVRFSTTDTIVARPGRAAGGFQRILVPTDFGPAAEHALARACELAAPEAEIDLFHVWQLPMPVTHHQAPMTHHRKLVTQLAESLSAEAREKAKPLLEKHRRDGLAVSFETIGGSASHAVIDRAAGYDLIAMGSHGHRGFKRFVLGSVAEQTVRHAPCSVFVTHASATEGA